MRVERRIHSSLGKHALGARPCHSRQAARPRRRGDRMRRRDVITLLGGAAVAWRSVVPASAEIEKFLRPCEQKLCPFFRASLAIPKGWQEDQAATKKLNMQVLVPRGKIYDNAEAVIYATVTFNS